MRSQQLKQLGHVLITTGIALLVTLRPAFAGGGVLPPQSHAYGKTYAEWNAAWWQWSLPLPVEGHPFLGCPTSCEEGQSGHVWFLAGGPSECSCSVPPGTALFFPLANAECSSLEDPPFHGDTAG